MSELGLDPEHVEWSRNLWESLNEGGEWTIPRSGAVLRKEGGKLYHVRGFSTEALWDVGTVALHFATFGVEVIGKLIVDSGPIAPLDGETRRRGS